MPHLALKLLTDIAEAAENYNAEFQPPRVRPGRFRPPPASVQRLTELLGSVPEIAIWDRKRFITFESSGEIHLGWLASSMVERVIDGVSAQIAFDELLDFLSRRVAQVSVVMGVTGISIESSVDLGEDVALVLPASLPPTRLREDMFDLSREGKPRYSGTIVMDRTPQVAMVVRTKMTVLLDSEVNHFERKQITDEVISKRDHALTAITLSGIECAPFVTSSSSWIDHPAYSYLGFGIAGYGRYQGMPPHKSGAVDPAMARDLYAQSRKLTSSNWPAIGRAAERLQRSRSHVSETDRAIDLGIAIEMVLLHELQQDRGELKHRTALRGAWLLGKNASERRQVFNVLRAAYDARSIAVHTGELTKSSLIEKLADADAICAQALRTIIKARGFPSQWDDLVVGITDERSISDC